MAECGVIDLPEQDLALVRSILKAFVPNRPVFVFGSRATGRARRRSDLDLAIGGDEPLTLRQESQLSDAFDESDLPISVDIIDLSYAKGVFRKRIESEWVPLTAAATTRDHGSDAERTLAAA